MPVKRRIVKKRQVLPDGLQRIADGENVQYSEQVHDDLVTAIYFDEYPDFPTEAVPRGMDLLRKWRSGLRRISELRGTPQ